MALRHLRLSAAGKSTRIQRFKTNYNSVSGAEIGRAANLAAKFFDVAVSAEVKVGRTKCILVRRTRACDKITRTAPAAGPIRPVMLRLAGGLLAASLDPGSGF